MATASKKGNESFNSVISQPNEVWTIKNIKIYCLNVYLILRFIKLLRRKINNGFFRKKANLFCFIDEH